MARLSKAREKRKAKIQMARSVNPKVPRQLRNRSMKKATKKVLRPKHKKLPDNKIVDKEFDRQKHMEKCSKIAAKKLKDKKRVQMQKAKSRLQGIKAAAWNRRKAILLASQPSTSDEPSTSYSITPEKVLATKRQARLSNEGYRRVNNLVSEKFDVPLTPKWQIEKARKQLEISIKYIVTELEDVCLESVVETMEERRNRLELNENKGKRVVFSLDKGRGRVTSTVSFVHHPRPNSCYNHLPLQVWKGSDSYEALKEHNIAKPVENLIRAGYVFFHGGDLSYLSTAYGISCAMTFPCLWCSKRFIRGAAADKSSIDFVVYKDRSEPMSKKKSKSSNLLHQSHRLSQLHEIV